MRTGMPWLMCQGFGIFTPRLGSDVFAVVGSTSSGELRAQRVCMPSLSLPHDYHRIKVVQNFRELLTTPFADEVNALCWPRTLDGDFGEVVSGLSVGPGITTIDEDRLRALSVTAAGRTAIDILLEDQRVLREQGLDPVLDCVNGYLPAEDPGLMRTDVCSFHADSATTEADTWLCTYYGSSSEGLRNDEAVPRVDLPAIRAELLKAYGGEDDDSFLEYLNDHYYDLHYAALPHARPFLFGQWNLWRIAIDYPDSPVPPCIHRAPDPVAGHPPRLLLIS